MTVVVQTPYSANLANGVTTLFGFNFQVLDAGDLQVSLDGVVQTTGFTIAGIGVQSGGNVTFAVAPANNVLVEIQRVIPLARSTDYQLNGDLPSDQVDRDLDRLWQALQDAQYFAGLTIGLPPGDTAAPVTVPPVATRANSVLAFDGSGKAISIPTADVEAVADNLANVDTVAANITGVNTVATNIAAVNTAAANIAAITAAPAQAAAAAASAVAAGNSATAAGNSATAAAASAASVGLGSTPVNVASAGTVNLTTGAPTNANIVITGTTTITGFTVAAGRLLFVRFAGSLTLTNNANIVTQTGASIVTQAGDTCILRATAANVVEVLSYREGRWGAAPGAAPMYACRAWVNFDGTGTPTIRASGNVSSITDNGLGDYTINFTTAMPDANYAAVIGATLMPGAGNVVAPCVGRYNNTITPKNTTTCIVSLYPTGAGTGASADSPNIDVAFFR